MDKLLTYMVHHRDNLLLKHTLLWFYVSFFYQVISLISISDFSLTCIADAAVVLGMILLTESANRKGDPKKRKILAIVGLVLLSVFFSWLLSIFRSKTQGYPYR